MEIKDNTLSIALTGDMGGLDDMATLDGLWRHLMWYSNQDASKGKAHAPGKDADDFGCYAAMYKPLNLPAGTYASMGLHNDFPDMDGLHMWDMEITPDMTALDLMRVAVVEQRDFCDERWCDRQTGVPDLSFEGVDIDVVKRTICFDVDLSCDRTHPDETSLASLLDGDA